MKHLIFSEWLGIQEIAPAIPGPGFKPFALTDKGQVVYSNFQPRDAAAKLKKFNLTAYSDAIQKERRALTETVLGYYALTMPSIAQEGVDRVSGGIRRYWETRKEQLHKQALEYMANQGDKYLAGRTSFGRLDLSKVKDWTQKVDCWMASLASTPRDLPKIMNIHDNFLRIFRILGPVDLMNVEHRWVRPMHEPLRDQITQIPTAAQISDKPVFRHLMVDRERPVMPDAAKRGEILKKIIPESFGWSRSAQWARMQATAERVRPDGLFNPKFRGRKDVEGFQPTDRSGILPSDLKINAAETVKRLGLTLDAMKTTETRVRGMDRYVPDMSSMAPEFREAIERYNLNFGAGPSGTTGTLFTSAITFAQISGEDLKRYLMACVAYLVGGGMHTCHEVFTTFNLVGNDGERPYVEAKYDGCLPRAFRSTQVYDAWKIEFHDITG